MPFRKVVFWIHLTCGLVVGLVILIMCVTGVLLTYSRQMTVWADRHHWSPPAVEGQRAPLSEFVTNARGYDPARTVTGLTLYPGTDGPVATVMGDRWLYFDPSTAEVRGWSSDRMRRFLGFVQDWHRWLNRSRDNRAVGRFVTGWSNVLALFMVLSGMYLWIPRRWRWLHFKPILLYNRKAHGKARDFNWHHVFGFWMGIPLLLVIATAIPLSFSWARNITYRVAGATPPPAPSPPPAPAEPRTPFDVTTLTNRLLEPALKVPDWQWISVGVPADSGSAVMVVASTGWIEAHKRQEFTFDAATGTQLSYQTFRDFSPDRRVRIYYRYTHSGEHFGYWGQAIAGLASLAGVFIVWSGFALAWRRWRAWLKPRRP